ncbi:MAG: Pyridoxal-dependent decarboxylase [Gemmatimonadetes bacterium]|nr:Pyridoxal-dependent decarboxylase [Gemmatimonadota bacterium]
MTSRPAVLDLIEADCDASVGRAFVAVAAEYFEQTRSREGRVSTAHTPAGLAARFDEPLPRAGHSVESIIARLRSDVIPDCNRLFHPRYVGHQVSAPLPIAVWMESVTAALNQSVAVFEMSPVGTVLEHRVINWMCALAGYPSDAGGTMTTGGTEATFTALLAARNAVLPDAWTNGVGTDPPVLLCGEHAHYAVTRAAGELGIGMRNAIAIRSRDHKMDPDALRLALDALGREGRRVLAVVATAGSTATGSFDDLETIGALCDEHGVWLHVDGAHGASALLSRTHRRYVRGIERARSIAWDPHKMMLLPLQAGMVLVRNERDLDTAFSQRAPYLFQSGDAAERVWDQGTRSFLCSHRADVFKLWVALQRYGADALGELYDHMCANARLFWEEIQERPDFEAMHEPESNILCFRYLGPGARDHPERSDDINRELRERYNLSGEGWITATNLDGRRVLRVTMMNPRTTAADIRDVLDGLAAVGKTL